jgi:AraC-like DNA-binding protein
MTTRTYNDSFHQVVNLGLQRIDAILETLGRPERGLRHLHIAGTNGKGSVAAYLTAGLLCAGYRVGTFTSPSLVRTGERIRIDGEPLSDGALDAYIARADAAPLAAERMKEFLRRRASSEFRMEELCKLVSRSESQTIKIFKEAYDTTPYAYFLQKKIRLAEDMLQNTNLSVKQIAARLHFSDEYYFSGVFKRKTGLSPTAFRKGRG